MRKSKFTESQILAILVRVKLVCRKHGISNATYYQWKSKYAGMSVGELERVKDLEAENSHLKRMYAKLALENAAIKDVLSRKLLTPTAKRAAVEYLVAEHPLSRSKACRIVGFSRSALYKPTVDWSAKDAPVIAALNEMVSQRSRWGFWKCFHRLRADGHGWNHKKVHRVYCAIKLNLPRKAKKRVVTRERQPLVAHKVLNRIWALDFMRDTMYDGRPFRTLNVIDEGNREALRIECGTSIPSGRLVRVMEQLIEAYGKPQGIRLDNGPEMTSQGFTDWAEQHGVQLLFIQPGKPNQNAFIERFNKSFRVEVLDANLFNSISEVQAAADDWLIDYNKYRPHESLGDVPPAAFLPRVFNPDVSSFNLFT
ncbi:IS3 family transposase [Malikia spinosa]|uniref:IS3 family transposase n=1 Tax=Malikia spinosa TaxID=86180 RepID=UPI00352B5725